MAPHFIAYFGKVFDSPEKLYRFLRKEMKITSKGKGIDLFEFILELSTESEPNFRGEIWKPNIFDYTDKIFFGKMVMIKNLNDLEDWETMQERIRKEDI